MIDLEVEDRITVGLTPEMIRAQLELLVRDEVFRSSRRSVAFLRYVVEQTLNGSANQIKERTIGVEVFGRQPSYDTNLDHIVRTAATELRKRLAIYYGDEKHRSELRMGLIPGSYVPRFASPEHAEAIAGVPEPLIHSKAGIDSLEVTQETQPDAAVEAHHSRPITVRVLRISLICVALLTATWVGYTWSHRPTAQDLFWRPVLDTPGPVLVAIGDVPNGPPTPAAGDADSSTPILAPNPSHTLPFADAVTMARVVGALESRGKTVVIRNENSRTFSDLREGPVVLIGAFNNEWSLPPHPPTSLQPRPRRRQAPHLYTGFEKPLLPQLELGDQSVARKCRPGTRSRSAGLRPHLPNSEFRDRPRGRSDRRPVHLRHSVRWRVSHRSPPHAGNLQGSRAGSSSSQPPDCPWNHRDRPDSWPSQDACRIC